jgi:hypothetical protein
VPEDAPRRLDEIVRSPAGKADYRWAKDVAGEQLTNA